MLVRDRRRRGGRARTARADPRARNRQRHPARRPAREVKSAADVLRYFGGVASELKGETVPLGEHVLSYTRREPIGVVGAIVPWNAPVVLGALKIAMALARGQHAGAEGRRGCAARRCCAWRRSAQRAPAAGRAQPADRLRRGVRRGAGAAIRSCASCPSPDPPRSASSSCTRRRTASCRCRSSLAARARRSSFRTPTTTGTVDGVIAGMRVTRQGQSCTAGSRLFLHRSIFESFLDQARRRSSRRLKIGDPLDESHRHGRHHQPEAVRPASAATSKTGCGSRSAESCSADCRPRPDRWREGYFVSRPCSPTSATTGGLPARKSSAR